MKKLILIMPLFLSGCVWKYTIICDGKELVVKKCSVSHGDLYYSTSGSAEIVEANSKCFCVLDK